MSASDGQPGGPLEVFRQVVEAMGDGVLIADADGEDAPIVHVNPAFERITGYGATEAVGQACLFFHGEDRGQPERSRLRKAIADRLPCQVTLRECRKDGSQFWNEMHLFPVRDSGKATHFIGILRDVSERIRLENTLLELRDQLEQANRSLSRLTTHDALTDVANRHCFLDALAREHKRASREGTPLSILLIDLDAFHKCNEALGHDAGDQSLRRVAAALDGVLKRPADLLARYAGAVFAALLPATAAEGALQVAEAMRQAVHGLRIEHPGAPSAGRLTASIGVATMRAARPVTVEDLLAGAAEATLAAKEAGRDRVSPWEPQEAVAAADGGDS